MFDSSIREASYINIALEYLLLEANSKKFNKKKVLFDCWNRSWI